MSTSIATAGSSKEMPQSGHHFHVQLRIIVSKMTIHNSLFVIFDNNNILLAQRFPMDLGIPFFFSF